MSFTALLGIQFCCFHTTYIPRAYEGAASTEYAAEPITLKSAGGFAFPSTITLTHFSGKKKKFKNGSYLNIQNKCFCWLKPNIYASASLPIYWCLQPWKDPGSLANTPYLQVFRCHICSQLPAHLGPVCTFLLYVASFYRARLKTHFLLGKKSKSIFKKAL